MNIRQARLEDASALARLRWDFAAETKPLNEADYPTFAAHFRDFFAGALANDEWVIWVAEQDGQIVSTAAVQIIQKLPWPGEIHYGTGWVTNVYTRADYRNQGIGTQLLRHIIDWAKAEKLEGLNLWHSPLSLSYYERLGFVKSPDTLDLYLDAEP